MNKFKKLKLFADKIDINETIKLFANKVCTTILFSEIDKIEIVPILRGGLYLSEKLERKINKINNSRNVDCIVEINPIKIKTYNEETLDNNIDPSIDLINNNIELTKHKLTIIVDDILDSGKTLNIIRGLYKDKNESELFEHRFLSLVLLTKESNLNKEHNHHYLYNLNDYSIPKNDIWFVGCGMDLDDKYREKNELRFVNKNDFLAHKHKYI